MIGRLHHVVIDCPRPAELAEFYSELLGLSVSYGSPDWVVIAENDTSSGVAFQLARDHQPPEWRNRARPQQFHLDVMVDELASGATRSSRSARARLTVRTCMPTRPGIRSA